MPRSLSLTSAQINALTTGDNTILFNAQSRDILLYGGANLESKITILEIDNISGDCLTLKNNSSSTNFVDFGISNTGTFNVNVNGGNKIFNIVNHNGESNGLSLGGTLITATGTEINKLAGVTPGTASISKVLILNSSGNISGINSLSTTSLIVNGVNITSGGSSAPDYTTGVTPGTASASLSLVLDSNKDISGIRNLTLTGTISGVTTLTATTLAGTLSTTAQTNITSVGSLSGLTTTSLTLGATAITATGVEINKLAGVTTTTSEINTLAGVTAGIVTASKVLVVDSNKDLTSLRNLTATGTITTTTLAGTLSTATQTAITSVGSLSELTTASLTLGATVITATGVEINKLSGVTATTSEINTLSGVIATTSEINTLAGVTTGIVTASKVLVVDSNKDLSSLRNLTLTGTISGVTTLDLSDILTSTNATSTTLNNNGALVLAGGIGISNSTDAISNTNGGTFTSAGGGAFAKSLYVGTDLTVGGNLTISGTTTSVNSTNVLIEDNIIALNSGPSGTGFDSGFLTQRYQIANSAGTGDVVNDTLKETYALAGTSSTTVTLTGAANAATDYYKGWWIKIASGVANNQVRQITSYNGTTKVATLVSAFSTTPATSDTINLYNKQYSTFIWQEANDRFVTAFSAIDPSSGTVTIIDYANIAVNNQNILSITTSTSNSTGALKLAGGIGISNTTDATSSTNGGTFTSAGGGAFAKALFIGTTLTTASLTLGATAITATGTDINKLAGVTAGTVTASKALIVDSNKDLSTLRNLTLNGTLSGNGSVFLGSGGWTTTIYGPVTMSGGYNLTGAGAISASSNITTSSGYVSIGTASVAYPLWVNTTTSISASNYAYFNSSANTGTASGTNSYSAYFSGRILVGGEINVSSDFRIKKDIELLDIEYCKKFISKANPIKFRYIEGDNKVNLGFIAQDVYKAGFTDLVSIAPKEGLEKIIEDDGFVNPKDHIFTLTTGEIIPILVLNVKDLYEENEILKNKNIHIEDLENRLRRLEDMILNI